jgi:hypothetical protein
MQMWTCRKQPFEIALRFPPLSKRTKGSCQSAVRSLTIPLLSTIAERLHHKNIAEARSALTAQSGPWTSLLMLRYSFPKAVIGDVVQHLDWPDGDYAGQSPLSLQLRRRPLAGKAAFVYNLQIHSF